MRSPTHAHYNYGTHSHRCASRGRTHRECGPHACRNPRTHGYCYPDADADANSGAHPYNYPRTHAYCYPRTCAYAKSGAHAYCNPRTHAYC